MIEEREIYENGFVDEIAISKSEEMDYQIDQFEFIQERFERMEIFTDDYQREEIDTGFALEDYFDELRDEQMIERKLAEMEYLESIIDEHYADYDPLDAQIDSYNQDCFSFDDYVEYLIDDYCTDCFDHFFDDYKDDCFDNFFDDYGDDCYVEEIDMDAAYCGSCMFGYVVSEDEFDSLDGCDYPEGPDENLGGFRYPEYECPYVEEFIDYPDDFFDFPEPEYTYEKQYDTSEIDTMEKHMEKLIAQHLAEEREFYNFIKEYEVPDEYFLPAGAEDLMFS